MTDSKLTDKEEARAHADMDYLGKLSTRWTTWLAVGNAAGLVAFGNRVLAQPTDRGSYLIFPSCWIFMLGLAVVGASAWCSMHRFDLGVQGWFLRDAGLDGNAPPRWLILADDWLPIVSALLFLAGLLYPMIVLSNRYLQSGSFAG